MKKITILLLTTLLLTGCANKSLGEISEVNMSEPLSVVEAEGQNIFNVSANSDLEFETFYDYYAGFSIPYPKGWEISTVSANLIIISNRSSQITISHRLVGDREYSDYKYFKDSFKTVISQEPIYLEEGSLKRRDLQTKSNLKVISDIPLVISETYDNIKLSSDSGGFISGKYSEKRYYINYGGVNSLISVISADKKMYDTLDYMIGNMKTVSIAYDDSILIEGMTLPSSFVKKESSVDGIYGYSYTPKNTNDAFSGCFVQVYKSNIEITDSNMDQMINSAFNENTKNVYNNGSSLLLENQYAGSSISTSITNSNEYGVVPPGTSYCLEIYQNEYKTIAIGYPLAKRSLMEIIAKK